MTAPLITQERLKELLHYDNATGVFTRKMWRGGTSRAGSVAGASHGKSGYLQMSIDGRLYFAHRLAWLYEYGRWPEHLIDHINGDPADNRIQNLRDVPQIKNMQNLRRRSLGATGFRGVKEHRPGQYIAQISHKGVNRYLGSFRTPEDAHAAYLRARAVVLSE